jgi:hypothetical protein
VPSEIHTSVDIAAPPARVFDILRDLGAHAGWNPQLASVTGRPEAGARIRLRVRLAGGFAYTGTATVLSVEPGRAIRWRGGLPIPGLFEGLHSFEIEGKGDGNCRLVQREVLRGLLRPLILATLLRDMRAGFEALNLAVKRVAEGGTAGDR